MYVYSVYIFLIIFTLKCTIKIIFTKAIDESHRYESFICTAPVRLSKHRFSYLLIWFLGSTIITVGRVGGVGLIFNSF